MPERYDRDVPGRLSSLSSTETQRACRGPLLDAGAQEFRRHFNRTPFQFRHQLAHSPLFSLDRLAGVAGRMLEHGDLKRFVIRSARTALADARFANMPLRRQLAETIRQLADEQVWLKLTSADAAEPEYDAVRVQVLREVEELAGEPLHDIISWSSLTVFLASPRVVTPYHIDHESNFLFQISGSKDVSLYPPNQPDIVPVEELECFYAGDFEAARYRPEVQDRGATFRLDPGGVVHHPPLAPHWVRNGNAVSVSVSIGFSLRPLDRVARVHQVNHFLRRLGISPRPPGRSRMVDALKIAGMGMLAKSNPTSPDEILFSGLRRLVAAPRAVRRWMRFGHPARH